MEGLLGSAADRPVWNTADPIEEDETYRGVLAGGTDFRQFFHE